MFCWSDFDPMLSNLFIIPGLLNHVIFTELTMGYIFSWCELLSQLCSVLDVASVHGNYFFERETKNCWKPNDFELSVTKSEQGNLSMKEFWNDPTTPCALWCGWWVGWCGSDKLFLWSGKKKKSNTERESGPGFGWLKVLPSRHLVRGSKGPICLVSRGTTRKNKKIELSCNRIFHWLCNATHCFLSLFLFFWSMA